MNDKFNCYLCGNNNFSVIADQNQIRFGCHGFKKQIIRCSECNLTQLYPAWTNEELNTLYSAYSRKSDFPGYKPKKDTFPEIERYCRKSDRILEVGCGFGNNLKWLRMKGYNAIGIDRDPTVCDGESILNYDFSSYISPNGEFDFIYAIQVFEHMSDPREFIKNILKKLKHKGKFLLELPNIEDPLLRIYKNEAFSKFYWYPYHLFFYTQDSLDKLFREYPNIKFKIFLRQRYGLINHLRWLILNKPGNFNSHLPILDDLYKFILTKILRASDTMVILGEKRE